jgi:hypothetical protein
MQTRLPLIFGLRLIVGAALVLARVVAAETKDGNYWVDGQCEPILTLLLEFFDGVMPPALPTGWSSTTWVTSNSGVPTPPADTPPNAVFVDDPATISEKQLLSPNMGFVADADAPQLAFRNSFNLQDGFDGGVLEMSFDGGLTFQDVVDAGGTFVHGGYNGTISSCCGNPLAGRQAWTGNSGGFIDTTVNLPYRGSYFLRWRLGSDSSVSGEGWRVDNVAITQCYTPRGGGGARLRTRARRRRDEE